MSYPDYLEECPECRKDIRVTTDYLGEEAPGAFKCSECEKWVHVACSGSDDVCDTCWGPLSVRNTATEKERAAILTYLTSLSTGTGL